MVLTPSRRPECADADAARLAVIDVAIQLAQDHEVEPLHQLGPEGRGADQLGEQERRPEVGKQLQLAPQREQAEPGALIARSALVAGSADRAEQDGVGLARELERRRRQRHTGRGHAGGADRRFGEFDVAPATACSTLTASAVTSLPMPSPGMTAMFISRIIPRSPMAKNKPEAKRAGPGRRRSQAPLGPAAAGAGPHAGGLRGAGRFPPAARLSPRAHARGARALRPRRAALFRPAQHPLHHQHGDRRMGARQAHALLPPHRQRRAVHLGFRQRCAPPQALRAVAEERSLPRRACSGCVAR